MNPFLTIVPATVATGLYARYATRPVRAAFRIGMAAARLTSTRRDAQ